MQQVHVFQLKKERRQPLELTRNAHILEIQMRRDQIHLYAVCDPSHPKERREIMMFRTGENMPHNKGKYIGTVEDYPTTLHFFDRGPAR